MMGAALEVIGPCAFPRAVPVWLSSQTDSCQLRLYPVASLLPSVSNPVASALPPVSLQSLQICMKKKTSLVAGQILVRARPGDNRPNRLKLGGCAPTSWWPWLNAVGNSNHRDERGHRI